MLFFFPTNVALDPYNHEESNNNDKKKTVLYEHVELRQDFSLK